MPFGPNTPDETRAFIGRCLDSQNSEKRVNFDFAIELTKEKRIIGGIGIRRQTSHGDSASFGYVLNRHYWLKGYGSEAAGGIVKFGFEFLKVHRVEAICDIENTGSWKVMEKAGLMREGLQREALKLGDEFRDCYMYGILRTD